MDGDNLATLDQALAFIDSCEAGTATNEDKNSTALEYGYASLSLDDINDLLDDGPVPMIPARATDTWTPTELLAPSTTKKTKRRRSAASSSTALQRRKRAEIESLRAEATQLEGHLTQLKRTGQSALGVSSGNDQVSEWRCQALTQYKRRHRSEQMNWRLKKILQKQRRVSNQLKGMLFKRNVLSGMDFVRSFESPCLENAHFTFDQTSMLMQQLDHEVARTYLDFNQVYRPQDGPTVCATSQTAYSETCESNAMEFVTTTSMDCSLNTGFNHVWTYLESKSNPSRKTNTVEAKMTLTLPVHGRRHHFHKLHILRKFEEKDRIVMIWSDVLQMTTKNLRIRSLGYAVFTRSETNPSGACMMYTHLKIYLESPTSEYKRSPEDIQHAKDVVLRGMGRLMRQFWQGEQNRLLDLTCS